MWCGRNTFQSVQCSINFDNWRFSFDGLTSESWWKKNVKRDDKRGRKKNYRLTNMEIKKEKKGKKLPLKYSVKPDVLPQSPSTLLVPRSCLSWFCLAVLSTTWLKIFQIQTAKRSKSLAHTQYGTDFNHNEIIPLDNIILLVVAY